MGVRIQAQFWKRGHQTFETPNGNEGLNQAVFGGRVPSVVFANHDRSGEDCGPQSALISDGGLRDIHRADDFVEACSRFKFVESTAGEAYDARV
jgi:hypothetical protein